MNIFHKIHPAGFVFFCLFMILFIGQLKPVYSQETPAKEPVVYLAANPLGFLTMGPTINAEIAFSNHVSFAASYRLGHLGLITTALFPDVETSWTLGASLRFYINNENRFSGFFLGPGIEMGKSYYEPEIAYNFWGPQTSYQRTYDVLAYGVEAGYHWTFTSGFSLEVSDLIGVITSKRNDSMHKSDEWNIDAYVVYMLSVKVGIVL